MAILKAADEAASVLASVPKGPLLGGLDRVVTSANGTPVWAATTAGLAACGRRGRVAATEGAVAFALASAFSNLALKPVVDRRRPFRRLGRPTKPTSSFPSSHASTSFAYATAVVERWPVAGAPLLLTAGAIAASRVHTRQHRISEVLGGAVLGTVVGTGVHLASRRWGPQGRLGS
jgi:undecaprenyl-diphosphatase